MISLSLKKKFNQKIKDGRIFLEMCMLICLLSMVPTAIATVGGPDDYDTLTIIRWHITGLKGICHYHKGVISLFCSKVLK